MGESSLQKTAFDGVGYPIKRIGWSDRLLVRC